MASTTIITDPTQSTIGYFVNILVSEIFPVEGKYRNQSDKSALEKLSELDREQEFYDRYDAATRASQKLYLCFRGTESKGQIGGGPVKSSNPAESAALLAKLQQYWGQIKKCPSDSTAVRDFEVTLVRLKENLSPQRLSGEEPALNHSSPSDELPNTDTSDTPGSAGISVSADSPLTDSPLTDSPLTDSPLTDSPLTDSPLTDSPLTDSPLTVSPLTSLSGNMVSGNMVRRPVVSNQLPQASSTSTGTKRNLPPNSGSPKHRPVDTLWPTPLTTELSTPEVVKLVKAILSKPAAQYFCSLIQSLRNTEVVQFRPSQDHDSQISHHMDIIDISTQTSALMGFLLRQSQINLAKHVDKTKGGRTRAESTFIQNIRNDKKWPKWKWDRMCGTGRKWIRLLGKYDSLLCFILPDQNQFGISSKSYLSLNKEDIAVFHGLLNHDHITLLCEAAKAFQESLATSIDIEFNWEQGNHKIDRLADKELLSCLQPFPSVSENEYDSHDFEGCLRPENWPAEWLWPVDPTEYGLKKRCDLCEADHCGCIHKQPETKPRIRQYGRKGRGLQAVARETGQVAYRNGEIIGFLMGEVVPMGRYSDKWTLDFARPDIPGEPTVCQIYTGKRANIFRLLNHSHKPNAEFKQRIVSGRWITAVQALADIGDGCEIEVSYGPNYRMPGGCLCRECSVTSKAVTNNYNTRQGGKRQRNT